MKQLWQKWYLALLMVFALNFAVANNLNHPAQQQMQQNAKDIMAVINNGGLSNPQKIQRLNAYGDRYLDLERIAALSVGAQWKNFTPQQKKDFIAAFKDMIISMYSNTALLAAQNAKINVLGKNSSANRGKASTNGTQTARSPHCHRAQATKSTAIAARVAPIGRARVLSRDPRITNSAKP